jgi:prevent-host-death family protein
MNDGLKVPASEFQKNVGRYSDLALTQPVTVTRNGRDRNVMVSAAEYHRLKRRDRDALGLDDFTDADLDAIRAAKPARGSAKFDPEVS